METIRLSVTLAKTGTTAHTQYFPTPSASSGPGSKWKFLGAQIQPQATLAAHATDYRTVDMQVGGTSVVTSMTSAATAFTAGTTRAFTVTGVGSAIEVTRAAPLSAVLAHAGSGGTFEGTVTAEFEVLP